MKRAKKWDAAEFLDDDKSINEYLIAALKDGDQELFLVALGNAARAKGMSQLAEETGITRDGLYKALAPTGNPSFLTVTKVLNALGFEWELVELDTPAGEYGNEQPNAVTLAAMKETEDNLSGKSKTQVYKTPEDLFKALGI